jgi:hypothetical protein
MMCDWLSRRGFPRSPRACLIRRGTVQKTERPSGRRWLAQIYRRSRGRAVDDERPIAHDLRDLGFGLRQRCIQRSRVDLHGDEDVRDVSSHYRARAEIGADLLEHDLEGDIAQSPSAHHRYPELVDFEKAYVGRRLPTVPDTKHSSPRRLADLGLGPSVASDTALDVKTLDIGAQAR